MTNHLGEVVIVGAHARSQWLAAEWLKKGAKVTVIDLTEALGPWGTEDWTGPFGLFKTENITNEQVFRLSEDEVFKQEDRGFVFLLENGPIEMRGPVSEIQFRREGVGINTQQFLVKNENKNQSQKEGFSKNWLAQLSLTMMSSRHFDIGEGFDSHVPMCVSGPYFVHQTSRRKHQKFSESLAELGVVWLSAKSLTDVKEDSIEVVVADGKKERVSFESLFWLLSTEETHFLSQAAGKNLVDVPIIPTWVWSRSRVRFLAHETLAELPLTFAHIKDRNLHWSRENLALWCRTPRETDFDVWLKIPYSERHNKKYLEEVFQTAIRFLTEKIPNLKSESIEWPQGHKYNEKELGPHIHPVFMQENLKHLKLTKNIQNVQHLGPEQIAFWCWNGWLDAQQVALNKEKLRLEKVREEERRIEEKNKRRQKNSGADAQP